MNAPSSVIEVLNDMLKIELTAYHQYLLHSKINEDNSLKNLATVVMERADSELEDAKGMIDMILMYDGQPIVDELNFITTGLNLREQFALDLIKEKEAVRVATAGVKLCQQEGMFNARDFLETVVAGEEDHVHWLETQIYLIETVGQDKYIAEQIVIE